jgi:serine/threonine protein kinase
MDDFLLTAPQRDYRFGPELSPDKYRLVEPVNQQASEGQIWLATTVRQNKGLTGQAERELFHWAVKIVDASGSLYRPDQTLREALHDLAARYMSAKDETAQAEAHGIIGPTDVFIGGAPHPFGQAGRSLALYVTSRWIDGVHLLEWRRRTPPRFNRVCDLLDKLAAIIDGLAYWGSELVHRDIAPENVMVRPDGQPFLIDFTYARPPNSAAATEAVRHRGYTPPEALSYEYGLPGDRYSFGAVAFFLLSGEEPPLSRAAAECRATLIRNEFSADVADHVAALLTENPAARPDNLARWTAKLRQLGAARRPALGRYRALAMTVDGTSAPVVTVASEPGAYRARLATGLTWQLSRDPGSPQRITALSAVTDGSGSPVTFAVTDDGTAFAGRGQTWTAIEACVPNTGLTAIRGPYGEATAFVVGAATGMLDTITVSLGGRPQRLAGRYRVRRVLSAAPDRDGRIAVVAILPGGELGCVTPAGVAEICPEGAAGAAACLDQWGELRCYRLLAGTRRLACFDQSTGRWGRAVVDDDGDEEDMPFPATEIACVAHRGGVTVAIAGTGGVCVTTHDEHGFGRWHQVTGRPSTQVNLAPAAAWRLRLSALVEGRAGLAAEQYNGWPDQLIML